MTRVTNKEVRGFVQRRVSFKTNNGTLWGEPYENGVLGTNIILRRYVVYSYQYDWPIFVAEEDEHGNVQWYENVDKVSATTSRHVSAAHPHVDTLPMSRGAMVRIAREGIAALAVKGEHPGVYVASERFVRHIPEPVFNKWRAR